MPVNRTLWGQSFFGTNVPAWPCPTCRVGLLELEPKSLHERPSADTVTQIRELYFEADMYRGVFVAMLSCSNGRCKEAVALSGVSTQEEVNDPANFDEQEVIAVHLPLTFQPPVMLITIPEATPEPVVSQLRAAEAQAFAHPAAAGNSVRSAVERLLDDRGIRKTITNKRGNRTRNPLHSRIEEFAKVDSSNGPVCSQ